MKKILNNLFLTLAMFAVFCQGALVQAQASITGDYTALETAIEGEWTAMKTIVIALAAALIGVTLMWRFARRFVKAT